VSVASAKSTCDCMGRGTRLKVSTMESQETTLHKGRASTTTLLLLMLIVEIIACGLALTAITATYVRSVVTPREWSLGKRLVKINEFFWSPNIAVDCTGAVHITYADYQQKQVRFYYTRIDAATGSVANPVLICEYSVSLVVPSLAVDQEGNAHIAWLDGRENRTEIYYAEIAGSPPTCVLGKRLSSNSTDCGEPYIAVDLEGNVHVVWHCKKEEVAITPVDYELFCSKIDKDGVIVLPEMMLLPSDGYYSVKPCLTVDRSSVLHLTWIDNRNTEIRDFHEVFYKKLDSEWRTLSNETVIGRIPKVVNVDHAPAALVDKQGNTAFVFVDRSRGRLFEIYAKKIDTQGRVVFDRLRLASSRVFSETGLPSAMLDNDDDICVVYGDVRSDTVVEELRNNWAFETVYGGWRFAPLYLNLRWRIFFSRVDSSGRMLVQDRPVVRNPYGSSSPAISVDSSNIVHIIYLEDDREQYRLIHVNSVSDNAFSLLTGISDQSDRILQNLGLSLALVPIFTASNVLFLSILLLFSTILWGFRGRTKRFCALLHSPSALLALCVMLKYVALASGYEKIVQFYPGGLSQAVTGILAAVIVRHGLRIMKAKIESGGSYVMLAATWMILDTFYNLCLISPIAIEPVY